MPASLLPMMPPALSKGGRSKVRQQMAQQPPYIRRASLPAQKQTVAPIQSARKTPDDAEYELPRMGTSTFFYAHDGVQQ